MVYVWEFEFFESNGHIDAFPFPPFEGGTFGDDFTDAVESAVDWLGCMVEDHLMNGTELPEMEFGHKPEQGGTVIAVDVERKLEDIPAVTASEASRMMGVSTARVAQLVKSGYLDSWKVGGTRMVSLASVKARIESDPKPGRPRCETSEEK